jgi:UDP-N-acetylmuramate--alanine ligase
LGTDFFENIKRIHFVGIGGVSMSGIAEILHTRGFIIQGSDRSPGSITEHLKSIGVTVFEGHNENNITNSIDLIVYTVAVKNDNPELAAGRSKNIQIVDRAFILGEIMKGYRYPICVSGIHGKTTTTSMMSQVLLDGGYDPTISVGGFFKSINGNFRVGSNDFFVNESCEYFDSFLKFYPYIGIILNIEEDHLDYFKDLNQIEDSFNKFVKLVNKNGAIVISNNIKNLNKILQGATAKIITFGNEGADYSYDNLEYNDFGYSSFDILNNGRYLCHVELSVPGFHNVLNALAVFASSEYLGVPTATALIGIKNFAGTNRRFQLKGHFNGAAIIDDYAHHPTEIKSTINGIKNIKYNKLFVVFQPHTYTRTKLLFDDFVTAFDGVDTIIVTDIYAAREVDSKEIHSKDLVKALENRGLHAIYIDNFDSCAKFLCNICSPNDLLITMGAGDVYKVGDKLLLEDLSTLSTGF